MRYKLAMILLLLLFSAPVCFAQSAWTHITEINGEPLGRIEFIVRDSFGNMWVLDQTHRKLYQLQNEQWNVIPIDISLSDAVAGENGTMWFSGHDGLAKYSGQEFEYFLPDALFLPRTSNNVIGIKSDGTVVVKGINGIVLFDGNEWQIITVVNGLPTSSLFNIRVSPEDDIWCCFNDPFNGPEGIGAAKYDGSGFTRYNKQSGLLSDMVVDFAFAPNETVYLSYNSTWGGFSGGIMQYTNQTWSLLTDEFYGQDLAFDPRGNLWTAFRTLDEQYRVVNMAAVFDGTDW